MGSENVMTYDQSLEKRNWLSRRSVVLLFVVALIALLFVIGELRVLPYLLLLACPLKHMLIIAVMANTTVTADRIKPSSCRVLSVKETP